MSSRYKLICIFIESRTIFVPFVQLCILPALHRCNILPDSWPARAIHIHCINFRFRRGRRGAARRAGRPTLAVTSLQRFFSSLILSSTARARRDANQTGGENKIQSVIGSGDLAIPVLDEAAAAAAKKRRLYRRSIFVLASFSQGRPVAEIRSLAKTRRRHVTQSPESLDIFKLSLSRVVLSSFFVFFRARRLSFTCANK